MGVGSGVAAAAAAVAAVGGMVLLALGPDGGPAAQVRVDVAAAAGRRPAYEWPTGEPATVLRAFTAPAERWSAGHRGVDLALADGAAVRAASDGVVAFAGAVAGRGVVSVDHADGVRTTYEPVAPAVIRGEAVAAGQVVGQLEGAGHCAPATCLHWGARRGREDYLDPLTLLSPAQVVRLLPRHAGGAGGTS